MVSSSKVADLSKVGVMSLSMHVKSELVGEMSGGLARGIGRGGLARHSRSATWRGRNKAHPVVSSPSTPLCATQRIVDPLVYASKANNLHYALPVTLTAGGEGDVASCPPSSVEAARTQPRPLLTNTTHRGYDAAGE